MADAELNRDVLEEVFPVECDLVGSENMNDLCEGHADFADSGDAYRMDVGALVELLANATTVIGFVWTLLQARPKNALPAPTEIDELVVESVEEGKRIASEQRHAIYISLRKKRDAKPG